MEKKIIQLKRQFSIEIPVRNTDVGFGLHLPFNHMTTFLSEALTSFLKYNGFAILDIGGVSFIIPELNIKYIAEIHTNDVIVFDVAAGDFAEKSCVLFFQGRKKGGNKIVVKARIKIVFYDYTIRKAVPVPRVFSAIFS